MSETTTRHGDTLTGLDYPGAVVTGGANGIGAAIVTRLLAAGCRVVVLDVEDAQDAPTLRVDLADPAAVITAAGDAVARLGRVDILVNCAGVATAAPVTELDMAAYHRILAVNLHAPVLLMRELCGPMRTAGYGRVVNVTSVHGRLSEPGSVAYDVSKAGLEAATRTAAIELASAGVLVNAIAPGFVATRMSVVDGVNELESDWFTTGYLRGGRLPIGRAATAAEIAEVAAWFASGSNTYTTGQVITVDGGLSARF
ncbi:MAG TPA: SDR family NAD(P)-dependent oxidoreductase [Streptosporangiaceae bacterium]|nr:SDR family NAD(P)-dependent oxidoreductase [Streptosporangiaceae bacterium]